MGKNGRRRQSGRMKNEDSSKYDDEVDQFVKTREERIREEADDVTTHDFVHLDGSEESSEEENVEDAMTLNLPDSDDDDADDLPEVPFEAQRALVRAKDDYDEEEQETGNDEDDWGNRKGAFYDGDDYEEVFDDDGAAEEEEAKKIQRKLADNLEEGDFWMPAASDDEGEEEVDKNESVGIENYGKDLELLSDEKKREIVTKESPELLSLLEEYETKLKEVKEQVKPLLDKAKRKKLPTSKGISYLEVKFHLLLTYCMNISFYMLLKAEGKSVRNHPVIAELVRTRTFLEKLRPLDKKMKYQIEKMLQRAADKKNEGAATDPLQFRPRPEDLQDEEWEDQDDKAVYKPPQVESVDLGPGTLAKKEKDVRKMKKLVNESSILRSIRDEMGEAPVEEKSIGTNAMDLDDGIPNDVEDFEEKHFARLTLPKKLKKASRVRRVGNELEDLEDFADVIALDKMSERMRRDDRASLNRHTGDVVSEVTSRKRNRDYGDVDVPLRSRKKQKASERVFQQEQEGELPNIDHAEQLSDDEYYKEVQREAEQRKEKKVGKKRRERLVPMGEDRDVNSGEKRKATPKILKNRGLMPYRKKEDRIPRLRLKKKYAQATSRRKGQVREAFDRSKVGKYGGEETGIKKNVSRSVSLSKKR